MLLDASAQHAGRTGAEILTLATRTMGLPTSRVSEMLDLVSLTADEADRRLRDYSLGMRQRLGIAHALLGEPDVLILDEPANGLDPAGIRWMRDLLRDYADRGGTVLLSSHLLHEIEVVADHIVVIGNGRIVADGSKSELLSSAGTQVRCAEPQRLRDALTAASHRGPRPRDGSASDRHRSGHGRRAARRRGSRRRRPRRPPGGDRPRRAASGRRRGTGRDVPRAHCRHAARRPHLHGRSGGMTTATSTAPEAVTTTPISDSRRGSMPSVRGIPLTRVVAVELRKSFDTRSGMWLLASIGIAAVLTTGAIIAWSPSEEFTYSQFVLAIGMPMTVILPIIAALSVTAEWTQRTGLATFTLVPHRGRVLLAKALASVIVAAAATVVTFAVAVGGNLIAARIAGITPVWDGDATALAAFAAAITLLMLTGFMLGALIRNSAGAIVSYMLYAFVAPGVLALLAMSQEWFRDLRPWVDAKFTQDALMQGGLSGDQWTHLAVTTVVWLVIPLTIGVMNVLRSEVK